MIQQYTNFFEKSRKNPYTHEELTIQNLLEYNMRDDIKNKFNEFLIKKII